MRQMKFRGKRVDTNEWAHGSLAIIEQDHLSPDTTAYFIYSGGSWVNVYPETVGEFIGVLDKDSQEIYEDDIVHRSEQLKEIHFEWENNVIPATNWIVVYKSPQFILKGIDIVHDVEVIIEQGTVNSPDFIKIIGNIHDTPELAEPETKL